MSTRITPLPLSDFPLHCREKIRFADTDKQGHVNNAVFATYLEVARVEVLYDAAHPLNDSDAQFVIASIQLDLLNEINWPGDVEIGTGVLRVGNSSITLRQAMYQNGTCVAMADTVIVQMHLSSRRSQPLNQRARDLFNANRLPAQ